MIHCPQCTTELPSAEEQLCLVCKELVLPELIPNAQLLIPRIFTKNDYFTWGVEVGEEIYIDEENVAYVIKNGELYERYLEQNDYELTQYEVKTITSKPLQNKSVPIDIETIVNLILVEYNLEVDSIVIKDVNGVKYKLVP